VVYINLHVENSVISLYQIAKGTIYSPKIIYSKNMGIPTNSQIYSEKEKGYEKHVTLGSAAPRTLATSHHQCLLPPSAVVGT
jgi:hypothetical protein